MKTILGVRIPEMSDYATTPADLETLVTDVIAAVATKVSEAVAPLAARVANLEAATNANKVRWGRTTINTDANGIATLTHGANFVPVTAVLTPESSRALAFTIVAGSATATQIKIRVFNVDTGAALTGASTGCHWVVRA